MAAARRRLPPTVREAAPVKQQPRLQASAPTQESESAAGRAIAVTVDGDLVRTKYFAYSRKEIETTIGCSLDDACLPALLGCRNSRACPTPNIKRH
jgi:hypothetical protein